jgi:hypothetical protein
MARAPLQSFKELVEPVIALTTRSLVPIVRQYPRLALVFQILSVALPFSALAMLAMLVLVIAATDTPAATAPWWQIALVLVLGIPVAVFGVMISVSRDLAKSDRGSDPITRLRSRALAVEHALGEAERVMAELGKEMAAQRKAFERSVSEAEAQQKLLEVNREQAELIRTLLFEDGRRTARQAFYQNFGFFFLGLILGPLASEAAQR